MCNICIHVPLCQWDGYWFDLGPFSPCLGLGALSYFGLDLQPTPAQAFLQWSASGGVISPTWWVCPAGSLDLGPP